MLIFSMFTFTVSQASTDLSSAMRLSISETLSVGVIMPGSGSPIGPHSILRNSNGSGPDDWLIGGTTGWNKRSV